MAHITSPAETSWTPFAPASGSSFLTLATPSRTCKSSPPAGSPWSRTPPQRSWPACTKRTSCRPTSSGINPRPGGPGCAPSGSISGQKNTLVFLPLLLAHAWRGPSALPSLTGAALAFLAFGLCASATYIVNDLLDIEADRRHPSKRRRPFAAGNLSAIAGVGVVAAFLIASIAIAIALPLLLAHLGGNLPSPHAILKWLLVYAISTTAYSLALKRVVLVDVIVLSGLYTVRILAGSAATGIPVSTWLGGFSIFFFLSLAFIKRFAELENLRQRDAAPSNGRGYLVSDIEQLRSFGTSAAYASVVVLTLYISNLDTHLYHHPARLWLLLPVLLLWVSQLWLLASRGELNEDPVVFAITDKRSLLLGVVVVGVVLSAL